MSAALDRTAVRERNEWLWLHNEARTARPSESTLCNLAARYPKGVRFRIHQDKVHVYNAPALTIFKPVVEVLTEVKGKLQWVTYLWFERETFDEKEV